MADPGPAEPFGPLAAAALHDLGLHRATDVIGGFRAWVAAGLPFAP
jgi:rhodanese-related sulfurtransferase